MLACVALATHHTRAAWVASLWPVALEYWQRGIGGGQAAPYVVREQDARWEQGKLTANGMEPLSRLLLRIKRRIQHS